MTLTIPRPDNPQHVDNLRSVALMEAQGFQGGDASLAESLFCYGLAWRDLGDEWLVVYRHPSREGRFDRCTLAKDTDPKREWNWVKWHDVAQFAGTTVDELLALPLLPHLVESLVGYYGTEEIFGSSYWEGFAIEGDE